MRLDGRVLALANPVLTGTDIDRLHEELSQLGDPYRQLVQPDVDNEGRRQFGEGTLKAVTAFQEANRKRLQEVVAGSLDGTEEVRWSGVWGTVDPATAQVINEQVALATQLFVVRGCVEYEDGTPAEGVRVTVYDRDIGKLKQKLSDDASPPTNAGGVFPEVRYAARAYALGEGRQGASADLVFELAHEDHNQTVDVDRLHEELSQLGDPYRQLVLPDVDNEGRRQFGEGTLKAVSAFQEANRKRLQEVVARSLDDTEEVRWSFR